MPPPGTAGKAACAPGRRSGHAGSASGARRRGRPRARGSSRPSSTSSGVLPGASPVRLATRKTCVSTAIVGSPKATLSTTLAVLRPTPGRVCSASRVRGTWPPCRSTRMRQVCNQVPGLAAVQTDGPDVLRQPSASPSASILPACRRQREQAPRGLVDAHVGGLRRQQHRGQQLEHAAVLQFRGRLGIGCPQRREEGFDVIALHARIVAEPRRAIRSRGAAVPVSSLLRSPRACAPGVAGSVIAEDALEVGRAWPGLGGQALVVFAQVALQALAGAKRSARALVRPVAGLHAAQPLRGRCASSMAMQSTGQTGMHSSQPVH